MVQDVATRWNSTYFLIERLLEQSWPVIAVLSDPSVTKYSDRSLDLTSEQWNLLAELKPVLHVLQVATYNVLECRVQCIYFCTPANCPRPHKINGGNSPAIRQCKCAISKELRSRWSLNIIDPTSPGSDLVAACLDPQFKQAKFLESHQRLDLQMAITDLAR